MKGGPNNFRAKSLAVLALFLICGVLSGLLFAWSITRPELQEFFFFKGDKFFSPRYSYWFTLSLIQLFGLTAAYLICRWRKWLVPDFGKGRLLYVALIIAFATPALRFVTPVMNSLFGLNWDFFVAPILYLILISVAVCVLTGSLRLLALAVVWNLVFVAAGFLLVYVVVRLMERANDSYEYVQWPIVEGMLALSFGSWIIWRQRVALKRTAAQTLAADPA